MTDGLFHRCFLCMFAQVCANLMRINMFDRNDDVGVHEFCRIDEKGRMIAILVLDPE